ILDFYRNVAQRYGTSPRSTMKDQFIRNAEVSFVAGEIARYQKEIWPAPSVADIGCGNGHLLSELSLQYPELRLFGVEFTPELAQVAIDRDLANAHVVQGDCRDPEFLKQKVDLIITERMLINLLSDQDKAIALKNIASKLKPQGRLLMIESFVEPWRELNRARLEMRLPEIPQSR